MAGFLASYLTQSGRAAFRTLAGLSVSTLVAHASAAGVLVVLARAIDPAQFGVLSFGLTAQAYLVLLGSFACGSVVIREAVRRPADLDAIATSLFAITAACAVLTCVAALVALGLAPVDGDERWLLLLLAVGAVPASMTIQPVFDAQHRQARGAMIAALAEVSALLAVLVLWRSDALALPAVGAVYAAKWGVATVAQLLVYHATVRRLRWRWSSADIATILRSSWPVLLAAMLFFVPLSAGVVVVRLRAGASEAAVFGLAYQVASAFQIFGALGVQVVQPHVYGDYGLHGGFLAKLGVFAALFLGGAGALALAGGWLVVSLLLPPFYRAALDVMPWLLAAAALLTIGRILSAYLVRFDEGRFVLGAQLASALLYVVGCGALPTPWVRTGAAMLAPGAALVGVALCTWRVRARIREAPPR